MEKLTHQEEEVMLIVWQKGQGTIREYHEASTKPLMPYTTFASVIKNLERKKYLKLRRIGGTTNLCIPLIEGSEYKRRFMSGVIRDYFQNSYKEMVSFFAKEEKISADELKEIISIIEQKN
ncbi:MAG: BlaI/MecI/CopY family transcriptional regulator [Tannerella sp.]|jgi:predicted transcriptional regulator|nr:BlaI/MecI/CopY family transcriptional regulator [Tannerella sp.]